MIEVQGGSDAVELGPDRHFMQKEIFEQPRAVADTLEDIATITPSLFGPKAATILPEVDSVLVSACGTSYYSSLVAKQWIETLAKIPCTVEIASEYRYRDSVPHEKALVVVVSQSGETADTLAALKHANRWATSTRSRSATSRPARWCARPRWCSSTRAAPKWVWPRPRHSPPSSPPQFLLALTLAKLRGRLSPEDEDKNIDALRHIPAAIRARWRWSPT